MKNPWPATALEDVDVSPVEMPAPPLEPAEPAARRRRSLYGMTTTTATSEHSILDQVPKQLYIAGDWRDGSAGVLAVEDPATGETLCEVADASTEDAKAALDAAVEAGPGFAAHPPRERGEILRRAFDTII